MGKTMTNFPEKRAPEVRSSPRSMQGTERCLPAPLGFEKSSPESRDFEIEYGVFLSFFP